MPDGRDATASVADQESAGGRVALGIEYDGTSFHGFARQPSTHGATVQGALETALSRVANGPVTTFCAGRTDAGVHATAQVIHFDPPNHRPARAWVDGVNAELDAAVRVHWVRFVDSSFHARFSARARRYLYVMRDARIRHAIARHHVAHIRGDLDVQPMADAAYELLGTRDFSAVRGAGCQARHPVRTITAIDVRRRGDLIFVDVTANAFLLHMVRNIAGALVAVGRGEWSASTLRQVLAGRDRTRAPGAAPACGLHLVEVRYPPGLGLPRGPVSLPIGEPLTT